MRSLSCQGLMWSCGPVPSDPLTSFPREGKRGVRSLSCPGLSGPTWRGPICPDPRSAVPPACLSAAANGRPNRRPIRLHLNRRLIGALIGALIGVENPRRFPNRRAFARFEKMNAMHPIHLHPLALYTCTPYACT